MNIRIDERIRSHIPALRPDEFRQLEENIIRDGAAKIPLVLWRETLVDGHNRYAICTKHGLPFTTESLDLPDIEAVIAWAEENQLGRRNLTADQFAYFIGRKYERLKRARGGTGANQHTEQMDQNDLSAPTAARVAAEHGVSAPTVKRAADFSKNVDAIAESVGEGARSSILSGSEGLTRAEIADVAAQLPAAKERGLAFSSAKEAFNWVKSERAKKADAKRQERIQNIVEISKSNAPLETARKYPIIYADPPWRYENPPMGGNRVIENHYPTMTFEEICALKVADLATPDAVLFMWAPGPKLAECLQVLVAWGFDYRTCAVWVKDKIGMGYYVRNQHELLLIAKRGEPPMPAEDSRQSSVLTAPRGEHSVKPVEFYEMIERMYPEFAKIELFSRKAREGWVSWGNQANAA